MITIIEYRLSVEDYKGLFDFENFTCRGDQDVHNEYYKYRFMLENKGFRLMPLSMTVESCYIKRREDENGMPIRGYA